MTPEFKKRIAEEALNEQCSYRMGGFIKGATYADRYWRERIKATELKDLNCEPAPWQEGYDEGRMDMRRELLGDEENK